MKQKTKEKGALTVEALLFLIPFMLAFLTILNAGRFVQAEMLIHHAITQTAKQMATYGYVLTKAEITDRMIENNKKSSQFKTDVKSSVDAVKQFSNAVGDFEESEDLQDVLESGRMAYTQLSDFFSDPDAVADGVMTLVKTDVRKKGLQYIAGELSRASIKNAVGKLTDDPDQYLKRIGIEDGLDGLHFDQTEWITAEEGKGNIKIVVTYTMKNLLFPQFDFGEYEFRQCASTLMW